jgi:2,5-dihydroxypyridine 5,6-dioxygenase
MTSVNQYELMLTLFREELKLCNVHEGETVAVLSVDEVFSEYRRAFLEAAAAMGAKPVDVNIKRGGLTTMLDRMKTMGPRPLANEPEAMQQIKSADFLIDLVFLLFSQEQVEIEKAGTRILLVVEPLDVIQRLFPTPELRRRVEISEQMLAEAKSLRFTNAAGTDVNYELGADQHILTEYGHTDKPGRWDNMTGGFLATYATAGVNGKVVMDVGDIVYPWKEFLKSPITFTVENSHVVKIDGGEDAMRLRKFIESFDDSRAYDLSHIGWGLSPKAEWSVTIPGAGSDGRSYFGNVLFSTGPNIEFGGSNDTKCHLDLPMRNCDLFLDGKQILRHGQFLVPELM